MPLSKTERSTLARAVKIEAAKLYQYRDLLNHNNVIRQQCIDNDLGTIFEHLRSLAVLASIRESK